MNYLFFLGHPAHFHLFRPTIEILNKKGHTNYILIKKKDILEDLLKQSGLKYYNVLPEGRNDSKLGIGIGIIKKDWELLKFCIKNKPDLMLGSVAEIAHIGTLLSIPSIYLGEDDAHLVKTFAKFTYPFVDCLISPFGCNQGKWNEKTIFYYGYQKLPYLHPNIFTPSKEIVSKYIPIDKPYFLLRFTKLKAYHDEGIEGITIELTKEIVSRLSAHGNVYISSEKELGAELEKYILQINPLDIHHVLAFAQFYVGDSQSMAVEAAMLGTPSIRFNDWVGKVSVSVLQELENKYGLTYGVHSTEQGKLLEKIDGFLAMPNLKKEFEDRRNKMLSEKIDVTAFLVWFIENYPKSMDIMKSNPDYQLKFR